MQRIYLLLLLLVASSPIHLPAEGPPPLGGFEGPAISVDSHNAVSSRSISQVPSSCYSPTASPPLATVKLLPDWDVPAEVALASAVNLFPHSLALFCFVLFFCFPDRTLDGWTPCHCLVCLLLLHGEQMDVLSRSKTDRQPLFPLCTPWV